MKIRTKRIISLLMAFVMMVLTLVPNQVSSEVKAASDPVYYGPTVGSDGTVSLVYHGQGENVYAKGSWDANWSDYIALSKVGDGDVWIAEIPLDKFPLSSSYIEYGIVVDEEWKGDRLNPNANGSNPRIYRNSVKNSDGSATLYYYPTSGTIVPELKVLYRIAGSSDEYAEVNMEKDAVCTNIYSVTIPTTVGNGTYEYMLDIGETTCQDPNTSTHQFTIENLPSEDPSIQSPVVNGKSVTFSYYAPTANTVELAGSMTNWADGKEAMAYNSMTGYWTLTRELAYGVYEYKFVVNGGTWVADPLNTEFASGNSKLVVSGLADATMEVEKGKTYPLPDLKYYDQNGQATTVKATYTDIVTENYTVTDGAITVANAYTGNSITIEASYGNEKANVIVNVSSVIYNYTIHYYSPDYEMKPGASDLYIWKDADNTFVDFTDTYIDTVNNITWVTAKVSRPWTNLNMIARYKAGTWDGGQESNGRSITINPADGADIDLWYVDGKGVFTELPTIEKQEERHLLLQYVNEEDPDGWDFYTWNAGYGTQTIPFVKQSDGTYVIDLKVKNGLSSVSFCIKKGDWEKKDGGDHVIQFPVDQTVVRGVMYANSEPTLLYPYNVGYEMDIPNNSIRYYYRDDALYYKGTLGTVLDKVELVTPSEAFDMVWKEENQRYEYTQLGLTENTTYYYAYRVTMGENQTYYVDKYNPQAETIGSTTYSKLYYTKYAATIVAKLKDSSMNAEQNNLLTVEFEGGKPEGLEVKSINVDLTALGGSPNYVIYPELMKGSIAVKSHIEAGNKILPVTLTDQYGNIYTTTASVNVEAKQNVPEEFDWDEAVIYFMLTDRFFNGNPSNDAASGADTTGTSPGLYQGGDFAGITEKLTYLKDLGVNTIWISPIVEQIHGVSDKDVGWVTGYHGYWAYDFTKLNPTFGTAEEFRTMVDSAHALGMKVMVDVVLNHSGYETTALEWFESMLRPDGSGGDDLTGSLSGLPDFMTERSEVREKLIAWQTQWVKDYGIDYFRVDTVKHVDNTTWAAFKNALTEIDPEFKMIGEYYGAGYTNDSGQLNSGLMDSLLDFDFNDQAYSFVTGNIDGVEAFLEKRNDTLDNTTCYGQFLSSHDEEGLLCTLRKNNVANPEGKMKVAASLQMTAKGQPVIYYGEEVGMSGEHNYPYQTNRSNFDWSLVNNDNSMYQHYKTILKIRNNHSEIFANGARAKLAGSNAEKYLVFSQQYKNESVLVALNIADTEQTTTITVPYSAGTILMEEYMNVTYVVDAKQQIKVTIPAASNGGTAVFSVYSKPQTPSKDSNNTPTYTTPTATPTVTPTPTPAPVAANLVLLNKANVVLKKGEEFQLSSKIYPLNATEKKVVYTSSDSEIATVSEDGVVTGIKAGKAIITVFVEGKESIQDFCNVYVKADNLKVTAKKQSAKKVKITWTKDETASGYLIYRKTDSNKYELIDSVSKKSKTSYTDTVAKGKTYTYMIKSYTKSLKATHTYVNKVTIKN